MLSPWLNFLAHLIFFSLLALSPFLPPLLPLVLPVLVWKAVCQLGWGLRFEEPAEPVVPRCVCNHAACAAGCDDTSECFGLPPLRTGTCLQRLLWYSAWRTSAVIMLLAVDSFHELAWRRAGRR